MISLINILVVFFLILLFVIIFKKQEKCRKSTNALFQFLNKNLDFLTEVQRKQTVVELQNSIKVYSKFQIIQKIANSDYLLFFKYNYSKDPMEISFVFTLDEKGNIISNSAFDKLIITNELLKSKIINSDSEKLVPSDLNKEGLKDRCTNVYSIIKSKNLNKCYYKNIVFDKPIGFIILAFKDEDFNISEDDEVEILRILDKIKNII